jgi:hypothetical protein
MSVVSLYDRRSPADRRVAKPSEHAIAPAPAIRLTRRRVWTALTLYCAVFWGVVGYAIYDIFGR